jgi:hypothetical protein
MTVADAIRKWSGGNYSEPYAQYLAKNVPGITPDTVLTPELLQDPSFAVPFAKASASWEAGRQYPMSDEQWQNAHRLAFGGGNDPRNVAMNSGSAGVDPDGAYGVAGAIQTADVGDAGVTMPATNKPAGNALTGSQQGMGMLADAFGADPLAGLGGMLGQSSNSDDQMRLAEAAANKAEASLPQQKRMFNIQAQQLLPALQRRLGIG